MKAGLVVAVAGIATILTTGGCDKPRQTEAPAASTPAPTGSGPVPTQPVPALPDPVVPKSAETPSPAPGQANDHSSPAFKGGGKTAPHK